MLVHAARLRWPPKDKPNADPFPGLAAFTEEDAGIFFGRDADILRGLDKLRILRRNRRPRGSFGVERKVSPCRAR